MKGLEKKQAKTFAFEVKEFRQDQKYFYFEGYLSTFGNEDRGGDIVLKGAFLDSLKDHKPSLFWAHDSREPLGVFDELVEDEKGLYVKARMPLEDEFVQKRIIPQMEIGSIAHMSIGYSVWNKEGEPGSAWDDDVRYLKRVYLWEGSLVPIPMNPEASLKAIGANDFKNFDERELEEQFRSGVKMSKSAAVMLISYIKAAKKAQGDPDDLNQGEPDATEDWSEVLSSVKSINANLEK